MKDGNLLLTGFLAGALATYFLDRRSGSDRRARVRNRLERWGEPASGAVLERGVRSVIGECVSNPRAIEVRVDDGRVVLSGPILTREADPLLAAVYRTAGARSVLNRLDYHDTPDEVAALRALSRASVAWTPATQLVVSSAAGLLVGCGLARRGKLGLALGACGLGLVACALARRSGSADAGSRRGWSDLESLPLFYGVPLP